MNKQTENVETNRRNDVGSGALLGVSVIDSLTHLVKSMDDYCQARQRDWETSFQTQAMSPDKTSPCESHTCRETERDLLSSVATQQMSSTMPHCQIEAREPASKESGTASETPVNHRLSYNVDTPNEKS
jgi:hypothetical protein